MPATLPKKKYASTQFRVPGKLRQMMLEAGNTVPNESLAEDGRESDCHVTCLYGLLDDNPESVRAIIEAAYPVSFLTNGLSIFETQDADVLKIDIISPGTELLNAVISQNCKHDNLHPKFCAHATICYLKRGLGRIWCAPGMLPPFVADLFSSDEVVFSASTGEKTIIKMKGKA